MAATRASLFNVVNLLPEETSTLAIVEPAHAACKLPSITAEFSAALPSPGPVRFVLHEPSAAELARSVANGAPPAGGAPPSTRPHSTPRWRSLATAAKPGDGGAAAPPAPIGIAAKRGNGRWVALMFDCGGAQTCAVAPELVKQV